MIAGLLVTLLLSAPVFSETDNLLVNPGFEELGGDMPLRWDHFVLPQDGAYAKIDTDALSGEYAIMLHTPLPYEREPMNNWSQNIFADLGGKTLRLTGHIRTRDAREASLWVQCWEKRPRRLLKRVTTSTEAPMYGTRAWEEVDVEFTVPAGTDFITVRCVLLGTGTAWFDDLRLGDPGIDEPAEEAAGEAAGADAEARAEEPFTITFTGPDGREYTAKVDMPAVAPEPEATAAELVQRLEREIDRLRRANTALAESLDALRESNDVLADEVVTLRQDVWRMQQEDAGRTRRDVSAVSLDPPKSADTARIAEGRKE